MPLSLTRQTLRSSHTTLTLFGGKVARKARDKKPNYFLNPPKFAFNPKFNFLVFPLIAFILG